MTEKYDVVVIGAGPAGYVAAIRAAQLGFKTACIDDTRNEKNEPAPGGTCLNVGCIPSKALLEFSELFARVRDHAKDYGIKTSGLELDLNGMMSHKARVVSDLTRGVAALFKANQITYFNARGKLLSKNEVEVSYVATGKVEKISAANVIIATGSSPVDIKAAPLQAPYIVDSTGALSFEAVPKRLAVIGAGVIGLELGSVWRRLGAEVVLLEAQPQFLTIADEQIAKEALKQFTAQGLQIRLGARVTKAEVKGQAVRVDYQDGSGTHEQVVDRLLVCVGRRPNTQNLFAPESGLLLDEWGFVHVDEHCRTNLPNVYAVGDTVRGPMLAHKGMEEGVMVVERLAGQATHVNYDTVPSVIYTHPEIAWAGKTEQQLKAAKTEYRVGQFSFAANGRAKAGGEAVGFVKLLSDAVTDRLLGAHLIGPHVSELIASLVLAMEFNASSEDVALTMFAHPTLSEAVHEAALSVHGRALHAVQAKRKN